MVEGMPDSVARRFVQAVDDTKDGGYSDYIRPFEADATGIIVPHVNSGEEARQIVEWVRFHPVGKRALDGGNVDGQFCLPPIDEYLKHSNAERIVILQIESPEALENVEKIAAVPGFNGLLFGPGDFSHSLGGYNTLFLVLFDPRVQVMVSSAGYNAVANYAALKYGGGELKNWGIDKHLRRFRTIYGNDPKQLPFDFPELLAALAPRP